MFQDHFLKNVRFHMGPEELIIRIFQDHSMHGKGGSRAQGGGLCGWKNYFEMMKLSSEQE